MTRLGKIARLPREIQTKAEFPALRRLDEMTAAGTPPKKIRVRQSLTLPGRQERGRNEAARGESDQIRPPTRGRGKTRRKEEGRGLKF